MERENSQQDMSREMIKKVEDIQEFKEVNVGLQDEAKEILMLLVEIESQAANVDIDAISASCNKIKELTEDLKVIAEKMAAIKGNVEEQVLPKLWEKNNLEE